MRDIKFCVGAFFLLSNTFVSTWGLSVIANDSKLKSKLHRPRLTLPGFPVALVPILGTSKVFRAPIDATPDDVNKSMIDSIILDRKKNTPKRTPFDHGAQVHILQSSHEFSEIMWSPQKAIDAAEQHDTWSTGRHHLYPTTDVPAIDLPNGIGEAALDLATKIILPSIALAFDTPIELLNFKDMFLAKYEPTGQPGLGKHTDGSAFSFNVLLSDPELDFEGGGTWIEPVGLVKPSRGEILMHRGSTLHEGCVVTKGIRYVLVGFVQSGEDHYFRNKERLYSKLLMKIIRNFPLGMVIEVDEGDKVMCSMVVNVSSKGAASAAGVLNGDCIRGVITENKDFIEFDGKEFDEVMSVIMERKRVGSVQMVIERWCSV